MQQQPLFFERMERLAASPPREPALRVMPGVAS
jgi:hypothetical protein